MTTTSETPEQTRASRVLGETMSELSAALRDVIEDTSLEALEKEAPEDVYVDLACRLVARLSGSVAIVSSASFDRLRDDGAARRIFDILSAWLADPEHSFTLRVSKTGRFELIASDDKPHLFFGVSMQDACAQMAQTILFKGGSL